MDVRLTLTFLYFLPIMSECYTDCGYDIPHGYVSRYCSSNCSASSYSCDEDYDKNQDVYWISCSSSNEWLPFDSCLPKSCPKLTIPNGKISGTCESTLGYVCEYSCNTGYQRKIGDSIVTCQTISRNWSLDPHSLCTNNKQCAYEVTNGDLDWSCRRHPGETCTYTCHEGYRPLLTTTVTCGSSLTWNQPLSSLCARKGKCPYNIKNGYIRGTYCTRRWRGLCTYSCNRGCTKSFRQYLICGNGFWVGKDKDKDKDNLCTCPPVTTAPTTTEATTPAATEPSCPDTIPDGSILYDCNRSPFSRCEYTCASGCYGSYSSLYCNGHSYWENGESACNCRAYGSIPDTRTFADSLEFVLGIAFGIPVLIVTCFCACSGIINLRKRLRRQTTISQVTAQNGYDRRVTRQEATSTLQNESSGGRTSQLVLTSIHSNQYTPHHVQNNSYHIPHTQTHPSTPSVGSSHLNNPAENISIAICKPDLYKSLPSYEEATAHPSESPPSYGEVTANPLEFRVSSAE